MGEFDLTGAAAFVLTDDLSTHARPVCTWASALLWALHRDEAAGRRPPRLTEPDLATWKRFRGRLSSSDLLALLFEDAAVLHPIPFAREAIGAPPWDLDRLPVALAERWLSALPSFDPSASSGADYIAEQATALGLPTRMARSELHQVKAHQRVLELPGTGGQLAHHLLTTQPGLTLQDNVAIACGCWQEATLAGIVALELGAPHTDFVTRLEPTDLARADHPLRQRAVDFVVGLQPEKGGLFTVAEQLALWFPAAKIVLV